MYFVYHSSDKHQYAITTIKKKVCTRCWLVVEKINRIKKEKAKDIQVCFVAINKKGMVGAYALQKGFNFSVYNKEGNKLNDAGYLI